MNREEQQIKERITEVIVDIDNVLELLPYINLTSVNKKKANKKLNKLKKKLVKALEE